MWKEHSINYVICLLNPLVVVFFQMDVQRGPHFFGAGLAFGLGTVYCWFQTALVHHRKKMFLVQFINSLTMSVMLVLCILLWHLLQRSLYVLFPWFFLSVPKKSIQCVNNRLTPVMSKNRVNILDIHSAFAFEISSDVFLFHFRDSGVIPRYFNGLWISSMTVPHSMATH